MCGLGFSKKHYFEPKWIIIDSLLENDTGTRASKINEELPGVPFMMFITSGGFP